MGLKGLVFVVWEAKCPQPEGCQANEARSSAFCAETPRSAPRHTARVCPFSAGVRSGRRPALQPCSPSPGGSDGGHRPRSAGSLAADAQRRESTGAAFAFPSTCPTWGSQHMLLTEEGVHPGRTAVRTFWNAHSGGERLGSSFRSHCCTFHVSRESESWKRAPVSFHGRQRETLFSGTFVTVCGSCRRVCSVSS